MPRPSDPGYAPRMHSPATRRRALASILALSALALGAGAMQAPAPAAKPAPKKVRLQLNWVPEPEFGGF